MWIFLAPSLVERIRARGQPVEETVNEMVDGMLGLHDMHGASAPPPIELPPEPRVDPGNSSCYERPLRPLTPMQRRIWEVLSDWREHSHRELLVHPNVRASVRGLDDALVILIRHGLIVRVAHGIYRRSYETEGMDAVAV